MKRNTLTTAAVLLASAGAAHAQLTTFTGAAGDDDWFNPLNWSGGAVPDAAATARINGATDVLAAGQPVEVSALEIGYFTTGISSMLCSADVSVADSLLVGVGESTASYLYLDGCDLNGNASSGTTTMTVGSAVEPGDGSGPPPAIGDVVIQSGGLHGMAQMTIGKSQLDAGFGRGNVLVEDGDIVGPDSGVGEINIGASGGSGGGTSGRLTLNNGALSGYAFLRVGSWGGGSALDRGRFELGNASAVFSDLDPSQFRGAGLRFADGDLATARLDLTGSYFSSGAQPVYFYEGTTLRFEMLGDVRAAEGAVGDGTYSAMDLASAEVYGAEVVIKYEDGARPYPGDTYDLIRLPSGAFEGTGFGEITVDYPATFTSEIVPATPTAGEILRLTILSTCVADVTTTNTNPGDYDYGERDGVTDGADLSFCVEAWLAGNAQVADVTTVNTNPGDTDYGRPDAAVDGADLSFYVEQWLSGCA